MKIFLVFIVTFLFLFQWSQVHTNCHRNPCPKGHPLKDDHGHKVKCRGSSIPCPNGYECQSELCCPTDPTTTTYSTPVTCPEFPDCTGGITEYDENDCPVCLIVDTCPGYPCSDLNYCFPTNKTFSNNLVLGMCYLNPCDNGPPLEDSKGFSIPCDIDGNYPLCPNEHTCTPIESNGAVCCPPLTTSTESTTSACPDFPDCRNGVIVYDEFGCPLCLIIDSCPGFPCPEFESCFPTNNTLPNNVRLGMCYANPCSYDSPLEDQLGFSIPCDLNENYSVCPDEYICTPTAINSAVCCLSATTPSEVTVSPCPPLNDCPGVIFNNTEGCPICLYYDTCIQVPCSEDHYCLVEDATINHWKASCVPKPCNYLKPYENESGITTLCTTDSSNCPDGFGCSTVPNDFEERRVCCPLTQTTTSTYPDSTTN